MRYLTWFIAVMSLCCFSGTARAQLVTPICGIRDGEVLFATWRVQKTTDTAWDPFHRGNTSDQSGHIAYSGITISHNRARKVTLAYDQFWFVEPGDQFHAIVPVEDLQYFEFSDWGDRLRERRLGPKANFSQLERHYKDTVYSLFWGGETDEENGRANTALMKLGIVTAFGLPVHLHEHRAGLVRNMSYDLVPTGAKTATLVSCDAGMLKFKELSLGDPIAKKNGKQTEPLPGTKPKSVKSPFVGDFWAYKVGGTYYILTQNGSLFAVKEKEKEKGALEVVTVWHDKERPLIGAIQDVRDKTVHVFGTDAAKGEKARYTFELSLKPKTLSYKTDAKEGDGFREVQTCVQAITKSQQP